ncbi:hypothetical protein [Nostoc sp.]|uniref:hypothetical protein n=1 Tax=Nostoc sp. TaxID=1180 RepID=UPI003FA5E754
MCETEERDRLYLERKVELAFFEAGKALMKLRYELRPALGDRSLYRSTHKTFEEYKYSTEGIKSVEYFCGSAISSNSR